MERRRKEGERKLRGMEEDEGRGKREESERNGRGYGERNGRRIREELVRREEDERGNRKGSIGKRKGETKREVNILGRGGKGKKKGM